jgi:hypothetical protein
MRKSSGSAFSGSGHMHGGIALLAVVTAHGALMVRRRGQGR